MARCILSRPRIAEVPQMKDPGQILPSYRKVVMPAYQKMQGFMQRVNAANPSFEKWKTSSLRPLINILNNNNGTLQQVRNALALLPSAKANKYKKALYYLLENYPGLASYAASVNFGALGKLNAARFTQTALPNPYNPSGATGDRVVAPSAFLNMTVEQFLFANANAGVILIHLSKHDAGMDMTFNGDSCIDHIASVLRVTRKMNRGLCILYMEDPPVVAALQAEVNGHNNKVLALEKRQHMGARNQQFLNFVNGHNPVVVMGFDATICVEANLFGAADRMDDGSWCHPLTSLTDVVTSRAVLVTTGTIFPKRNVGQWGVLYNT